MNSIDRNQPEQNHKDLSGQAATDKIRQIVADSPNCFFCSGSGAAGSLSSRPMNVRNVDDQGHLWFLTASDNSLSREIQQSASVSLLFQGAKASEFMQIDGRATLSRNEAHIDKLWEPILKTWFTEGPRDERIRVVEVVPTSGYYWDQKHGGIIAGAKMAIGALLGVTLDDSIQGKLNTRS